MRDTSLIASATNLLEMAVVLAVRPDPVPGFGRGADSQPLFGDLQRFPFRLDEQKGNSLRCFDVRSGAIALIPTTCREIGRARAWLQ